MRKQTISDATRRNWKRLNVAASGRLTGRANKTRSSKKFLPFECFEHKENRARVLKLLAFAETWGYSITDVLCGVAERLFAAAGILDCARVRRVLAEHPHRRIAGFSDADIPSDEPDLLGIVYQASLPEGVKNLKGSYYTPRRIASAMVSSLPFADGETFLDPCCGSGAFLISAPCEEPDRLFGVDSDPVAVMIAKFNLLLRYPERDFTPQVVCGDFLQGAPFPGRKFDGIATNPPWGASVGGGAGIAEITSKESFSLFFVRSFSRLRENGTIRFLLPEAVLNVRMHRDLRTFILKNCRLDSITLHDGVFSGVATGFVDMACRKAPSAESVRVNRGGSSFDVDISRFERNEGRLFHILDPVDSEIVDRCMGAGKYTLAKSLWALGVVTGDNKGKLHPVPGPGLEPVYTGKEIVPYGLKAPENFISYDRSAFQQTAKEEYYRAPEKLVYKFISDKLIFSYDDRQRLFLNSANILIPRIPGMGIRTVMALLNSELFTFLYRKLFGEVKILRGNLAQLPFPEITPRQDADISALADGLMAGRPENEAPLQREIYALFGLSERQIGHVRSVLHGNFPVRRVN